MHRFQRRGTIRPKISTMPRQKSEAAAFLDIYKLVVEKKRLQQELEGLDARRSQICDRIAVLEQQVAGLEGSVEQMRELEASSEAPKTDGGRSPKPPTQSSDHSTFYLDY